MRYFIYDENENCVGFFTEESVQEAGNIWQKLNFRFGNDSVNYTWEKSDAWTDVPNLDEE